MNYFKIKNYTSSLIFNWDDKYVFSGESHTMCEIVFVEKGRVIVTEENTVYTLEENQMIIHAPMEFHCIKSAANSNPCVRVMSFDIDGNLPSELTNGVFTLTLDEREDYIYSFDKAGKIYNSEASNELDIWEANCRMTAFLIRISKSKASNYIPSSQSALIYQKTASYMEKNISLNLAIDEIATQNFISKSYMKYLFQKYAGVSPKQYYTHLKIRKSISLIEQNLSICEITEKLNFSSPNYFSTFFKKHTGLTPLEYKLKYKSSNK